MGVTLQTVGIFILHKTKVSELRLVHNPEPHVGLFKQLEILPVPCQYTLSLVRFITNNQEIFQTISSIHNINTGNKHHFRRPNANLSYFQESAFHAGIKIATVYNLVVSNLKNDTAKFTATLRKYTLLLLCRRIF